MCVADNTLHLHKRLSWLPSSIPILFKRPNLNITNANMSERRALQGFSRCETELILFKEDKLVVGCFQTTFKDLGGRMSAITWEM